MAVRSPVVAASTPASAAAGGPSSTAKFTNVRVAVRLRPFNKRERALEAKSVIDIPDGKTVIASDPAAKGADAGKKTFVFDHSYAWDTAQSSVYVDLAKPIVDQALRGYNGTIFAYGQTGSGKTFSMMGDDAHPGIIPQMNADLFGRVAAICKDPSVKFLIIVSYLEIYNEVVKDLLNPSDKQLAIREHPDMGVYVQDLAELVVTSAEDVVALLEQGQKVRRVAATNMNERSSRSHSCFTLRIEQAHVETIGDKQKTTKLAAKINLVDLAGSERASKTGATGDTLKEGAAINKSLSALGNVINALAEAGKGHIPYRDSKLTRLLQHSLGGNSLTVMIAAISPADDNFDETVSTLQYANRAKNIKNEAKRNEDVTEQLVRQLREEIDALRRALAAAQTGGVGAAAGGAAGMSDEEKALIEEKIANLERAKQQSWDEKQRLSQLYEEERRRNLENENKIRSVMQTIKEDNKELMRRMRKLMEDRNKLNKRFKKLKDQHLESREALAAEMARFQELHADGGEDGPHKDELEEILGVVEQLHAAVQNEADELKNLKDEIKENEQQQMEARSEAAAQRMLLEEDAELRKAIQEEERAKLEKETASKMESRLEEERAKLREDAEREKASLMAKYAGPGAGEREQELELALIEATSAKNMTLLQLQELSARHEADMKRVMEAHRKEVHDLKVEELRMFRDMCEGFEEEKNLVEARANEAARLLAQAVADIKALSARNAELERQLIAAAAWEPPLV